MSLSQDGIQETLAMLGEAPRYIAALAKTVTANALTLKPDKDSWSCSEILIHLRACADVWGKDIRRMLKEDRPTIRYVSPRSFMKKTKYAAPSFAESFQEFKAARVSLIELLNSLSQDAWQRQGVFTGTTRGKHQTVFSYARRIADHEQHHFSQFERVLNAVKVL